MDKPEEKRRWKLSKAQILGVKHAVCFFVKPSHGKAHHLSRLISSNLFPASKSKAMSPKNHAHLGSLTGRVTNGVMCCSKLPMPSTRNSRVKSSARTDAAMPCHLVCIALLQCYRSERFLDIDLILRHPDLKRKLASRCQDMRLWTRSGESSDDDFKAKMELISKKMGNKVELMGVMADGPKIFRGRAVCQAKHEIKLKLIAAMVRFKKEKNAVARRLDISIAPYETYYYKLLVGDIACPVVHA